MSFFSWVLKNWSKVAPRGWVFSLSFLLEFCPWVLVFSAGSVTEVGQYQIVVQYQYQYFLKFHFQYQDQYQYCPWKTIKIKINIKTNIFSKCNIKIKINILKNLNSISIPVSISSIYWYWYWKSIFHWAMLTALDFLLHLAVISDEISIFVKKMVFCDKRLIFHNIFT